MAFPDLADTFNLLGHRMKDRVTGLTGVVTSISHDLNGCVQATLHYGLDKDGKPGEQYWIDIARLVHTGKPRVMVPPPFGETAAKNYDKGPATKPAPRAV